MIARRCFCEMSVLLALLNTGCGGRAEQNETGVPESAGSSGTSPATSGGGPATSAGTSSDGGSGIRVPGDSDALRPSTLVLDAGGGPAGKVTAVVEMTEPGAGPHATCAAPLNDGACQLTTCTGVAIGSPSMGYGDFGPISASVGATTVTLTYNEYGYGTTYFPESVTLGTGGIMTFRGGNVAGVPEFSVAATIPGLAVLTSPVPATDGGATVIDTSKDLSVTWSPISIGMIHFNLDEPYEIGKPFSTLECTFDGTAGSGVVSRALLSALKDMSPAGAASAGLSSDLETTTVVDGLTIRIQSHQEPSTPEQYFNVTLE